MVDSQMKQLKESSIAILLLGEWIQLRPQEAKEWMSLAKLYEVLQSMAYARKKNFPWKSAQALYRHLSTLQEKLESEYQAEFYTENGSTGAETVKVRFDTAMI